MNEIYYNDCQTPVKLGDVVEKRIFFRKRQGRVVYLPGVSQLNKEMNYNGLEYVGVKIEGGPMVATLVDPEGHFLQSKIRFVKRDVSAVREVQPEDNLFD
jgi:hypothetical protein